MSMIEIDGIHFCINRMQNILLFPKNIPQEVVKTIVAKISANKQQYQIYDETLAFDALTRIDDELRLDTFDKDGNHVGDVPRTLETDGIFHTTFPIQGELPIQFFMDIQPFKREILSIDELTDVAKTALCQELAIFIVANHPSHVTDWMLDFAEPCSEKNLYHFSAYLNSIDSLYIIRTQDEKIVATLGLNISPDKGLNYLSMVVTSEPYRRKHLASLLVCCVANTYPNIVMTQYIVAPVLRQILGEDAITHVGQNVIPVISGDLFHKYQSLITSIQSAHITSSSSGSIWLQTEETSSSVVPPEETLVSSSVDIASFS